MTSQASQNDTTASVSEQSTGRVRLFNFDLPRLKETGQALPEQAELSALHAVLDIACGNGAWAIAAAQAHPEMQFVGIDSNARLIEQAREQAQAQGVSNIRFAAMDPFQHLDLADGSFDLVNVRFVVGLLPAESWPSFLQECLRVTRPGGLVRLTETDLPITGSPAFAHMGRMISEAFTETKRSFAPEGRLLSMTPMLKGLLKEAGCQNVQQAVYVANFSAGWPAHDALTQDLAETYRSVQPALIQAEVTTPEQVEQVYQQMLSEMQADNFCATAFYLTAWGSKP